MEAGLDGEWETRPEQDALVAVIHNTGGSPTETAAHLAGVCRGRNFGTPEEPIYPPGICYTFLVGPDGNVEQTGSFWEIRWHVADMNQDSVGIALKGNFTDNPPPQAQIDGTNWLLNEFWKRWGRSVAVVSHHDWASPSSPTECPGKTRDSWFGQIHQD